MRKPSATPPMPVPDIVEMKDISEIKWKANSDKAFDEEEVDENDEDDAPDSGEDEGNSAATSPQQISHLDDRPTTSNIEYDNLQNNLTTIPAEALEPSMDEEDSLVTDDRQRRPSISNKFLSNLLNKRSAPSISILPEYPVVSTDCQLIKFHLQMKYPDILDRPRLTALDIVLVVDIVNINSLLTFEDILITIMNNIGEDDRLALVTSRASVDQSPVLHQLKRMTDDHKFKSFDLAMHLPKDVPADLLVALAHGHMVLKERAFSNPATVFLVVTDQLTRSDADLDLIHSLLQPMVRQSIFPAVLGVGSVQNMVRWHRIARALDIPCCAPPVDAVERAVLWLLRAQQHVFFKDMDVVIRTGSECIKLVAIQVIGGTVLLQDNTGDAIVHFSSLYLQEVQEAVITVSLTETSEASTEVLVLTAQAKYRECYFGTCRNGCTNKALGKVQRLPQEDVDQLPHRHATANQLLRHLELLLQSIAALDQAAVFASQSDWERGKDLLLGAYLRLTSDVQARDSDITLNHLLFEFEVAMERLVQQERAADGSSSTGSL